MLGSRQSKPETNSLAFQQMNHDLTVRRTVHGHTHTHTHTHTCTQTHIHTNTLHKHTSGHLVADLVMFSLFSHTHTHTHTHMHTQVIVMTQSLVVVVATLHRPHLFPTRNPLQCRPMRRRRTQYRTKTWYQLKKRMRLLGRCIC